MAYKLAAAAAVATVAVGGSYAVTAANSVATSKAGDGTGAISGYTITGVDYTVNGTTPTNLDQVVFTTNVAPTAGSTIKIKLVQAGTTWYSCTNSTTTVTCDTTSPQATVAAPDELRVVIAD